MAEHLNIKSSFFPDAEKRNVVRRNLYTDHITTDLLKEAYWNGYFPWPSGDPGEQIPWVSPNGRGIIPLERFHVPHTVKRLIKKNTFELRIDTAFEDVIHACATVPRAEGDTWIIPEIISAYTEFHHAGWAHSFEAWNRENNTLAGGLYGISIGRVFAGESMFFRESGASKFALAMLGETLKKLGVVLLDTQMVTPTTELFGADYYSGESYIEILPKLRDTPFTTQQLRNAFLGE
jgi:leucyl/phenylalanyl-tRNA--protein transferase